MAAFDKQLVILCYNLLPYQDFQNLHFKIYRLKTPGISLAIPYKKLYAYRLVKLI